MIGKTDTINELVNMKTELEKIGVEFEIIERQTGETVEEFIKRCSEED